MIPLVPEKLRRRQKHPLGYQEIDLLARMTDEGCPVCHLIANSDRDYFFWFFNEHYYEAHTLDALTLSLGFCLAHGASLAQNALGSSQLAAVLRKIAWNWRPEVKGEEQTAR